MRNEKILLLFVFFIIIITFISCVFFNLHKLYPEISAILYSNCEDPVKCGYYDDSIKYVLKWFYKRRHRNIEKSNLQYYTSYKPIVIVGVHHKTGTAIARKIFSKICYEMTWCCISFISKNSFNNMKQKFLKADVDVIAHNNWKWNPMELNISNYKFIHFYRHPYKKIVSAYRYHFDGSEKWTKNYNSFGNICNINSLNSTTTLNQKQTLKTIKSFCKSIHFCEECCLIEHGISISNTNVFELDNLKSLHHDEHGFICKSLGKVKKPLQEIYQSKEYSLKKKLEIESALNYYETLNMARVLNETFYDENTVNINVDDLNDSVKFEIAVQKIIKHLAIRIKNVNKQKMIFEQLKYFNLEKSFLYSLSMSNIFHRHVHQNFEKKKNSNELKIMFEIIETNKEITQLYQKVFDLIPRDLLLA